MAVAPRVSTAQAPNPSTVDTLGLQRMLAAEDARGTGPDGLAPLLAALRGPDSLLRRVAVRGLGRFQRPELGRLLLPFLADSSASLRAEAANAIAQSLRRLRRDAAAGDSTQLGTREAATELGRALAAESDPAAADALAQSLGRLLFPDTASARAAEAAIRARLAAQASAGVVHGLYTLARARKATGPLDGASIALLRQAALGSGDTAVRRLALLTLAATSGLDSATAMRAAQDPDEQVRRILLVGARTLPAAIRTALVRAAAADPSSIVRVEAVSAARAGDGPPDCSTLVAATADRELHVALSAIDSLGGGCPDTAATVAVLRRIARARPTAGPPDHRWQAGAHALLAVARLDSAAAAALLPGSAGSARWEVRQYAARAAAAAGLRPLLLRLARDPDHNVQEAAIAGLAATAGHDADSVYLRALESDGYQVVLAAAEALQGSGHAGALPALLETFDRLAARRSENARDPRMSVLARIGELGAAANALRIEPYLADFDTTVAATVATVLTRWTGAPAAARPVPLPIRAEPLAETFLRRNVRLRVTMAGSAGGGTFTVELFPGEAPATVARVVRLARERFYDGRVFQRVEPNFVVQGGGPDANEYVGDAAFMRDELARRTHVRGTLGISSRGRDTGDGQWFLNLVDNPLLDHEFTIFGRVATGRDVAERILEGDRIARVEVVPDR